jgi:diaminopimelate decarboxylase
MSLGFEVVDGVLHAERVPLTRIADACGTPTYVYSRAHLDGQFRTLSRALETIDHLLCYAVKANGNLGVLATFARLGAGFDIVSGGELERVLRAGGDPRRVVFSGVGKSEGEIDFALKHDILCFNVESASELDRLSARAQLLGKRARVSLRVNPDIDAGTHPYISTGLARNKFGVPLNEARALYRRAAQSASLDVTGIDCHIGSQITELAPFVSAFASLRTLADELAADGIAIRHLDLGGGLPVRYKDEPELDLDGYARALRDLPYKVLIEPGRYFVANGGVLLARVEYLKPSSEPGRPSFAVLDTGMNDLIRPPLYQAWHRVDRVVAAPSRAAVRRWDLVGPVCESADFVALDRELALAEGDLLAIRSAGAYGMVQSSNYNARNRPAEVLVDGERFAVVRRRESMQDQLALEALPDWDAGGLDLAGRDGSLPRPVNAPD